MSDPAKLEIETVITGAEDAVQKADEVKKSIFGTISAEQEAQAQSDKTVAQQAAKNAADEKQVEMLGRIFDAQDRLLGLQLAQALAGIGGQLRGISPELDLVLNSSQNFLNVFASTGDPIKATLALTASAIGSVVTAYQQAEKQAKQIAKTEKENLKEIAELRASFAAQVRSENLEVFFQRELTALEKQEAALRRIFNIRASERELEAARQATAGKEAVNNGGDPNTAAAANLNTATANKVAALQDSLTLLKDAAETADKKVAELRNKAKLQIENSEENLKTQDEIKKAEEAAEKSKLDLAESSIITHNQIQTAIEAGKQSGAEISKAGQTALTEAVGKEREALKAEVTRLGSKSSSGAREALAIIEKILEDGVIKPEELASLREAQARVRGAQEASNAAVKVGFETTERLLNSLVNQIGPIINNISNLEGKVRSLQTRSY